MDNFKTFLKGLGTSWLDGEKKLLLPEEADITKEELITPAGTIGWYLRCYIDGAILGLAILGAIAKVSGFFNKEDETE